MRRAGAVLVALGLSAAGCASGATTREDPPAGAAGASPPSASAAPVPAVPGIEAEAVRLRADEAAGGRLQVRLTDTGTAPFTVTAVAIDSPGFAPLPPTEVTAAFAPRQTIDLPTPFGAAQCAAAPEPAAARLTVVRLDGTVEELRVPLTGGTLSRVHTEECAVEAALETAGIALTELTPDGERLSGAVVVTRRSGDEPVELTALARSVLLEPVLADALPVTLAPDDDELRLPVTFELATCDPHVLAETKKPFVFPLTVVVGERDGVPVDLPVDDAQRAALQGLVDRVCG
jgi:hypothetical protein